MNGIINIDKPNTLFNVVGASRDLTQYDVVLTNIEAEDIQLKDLDKYLISTICDINKCTDIYRYINITKNILGLIRRVNIKTVGDVFYVSMQVNVLLDLLKQKHNKLK